MEVSMKQMFSRAFVAGAAVLFFTSVLCNAADRNGFAVPSPSADSVPAKGASQQTVVLAGGCFWGIQAVFQHVKGVISATSGYSGGISATAEYELVSTGETGHAESVKITYDPSQITYGKLLQIFFSVAHDPTQFNRQGPDEGSQYRSAIFYNGDEQKRMAEAYIQQLNQAKVFKHPIVTQLTPLRAFYAAEDYHQDYIAHNPGNPYVVYNDLPKLDQLKKKYPELIKHR